MWELDHNEGWLLKNWGFWIVVLEKALESPLDSKEIKPFNPKGNQPWIFTGRTDAEAETPVLWPLNMKSQLIGKDSDANKDCRQKGKGWQGMRWSDRIIDSMDVNLSKLKELVEDRGAWQATVCGVTESWTWCSNWTTKWCIFMCISRMLYFAIIKKEILAIEIIWMDLTESCLLKCQTGRQILYDLTYI